MYTCYIDAHMCEWYTKIVIKVNAEVVKKTATYKRKPSLWSFARIYEEFILLNISVYQNNVS